MRGKSKAWSFLAALLIVVLVSGCESNISKKALPYMKNEKPYLGLRDAEGKELQMLREPRRIVSLTIRSDEILMELADVQDIIALSKWADDPVASNVSEEAKQVALRSLPSEEMIVGMKPDLVIASQSQPYDLIYRLRSLGVPVYVCPLPHSVKDTETLILDLGKLLHKEKKAKAYANGRTSGSTSSAAAFEFDDDEPTLDDVLAKIEADSASEGESKGEDK